MGARSKDSKINQSIHNQIKIANSLLKYNKEVCIGVGAMIQHLRVLPGSPSLVPSTHVRWPIISASAGLGTSKPPWVPAFKCSSPHAHMHMWKHAHI